MKPEGVRIRKPDGFEFEPELRHEGLDEEGIDVWTAVFEGRFDIGPDKLKVAVLPPRTRLQVEGKLDAHNVTYGISYG